MGTFILVLIIILCVLLCAVILMQNSKGGIASGLSTINQVAGVRASSDIEKITWGLTIGLFVLCVISTTNLSSTKNEVKEVKSEIQDYINENPVLPQTSVPSNTLNPSEGQNTTTPAK